MKRATRLASHYIRANDLRAVYLAQRRGRARIGITRSPERRSRDLRGWTIVGLWWCSARDAAHLIELVADACPGIDRKPFSSRKASDVAGIVPAIARAAKVAIASNDQVQRRAAAVVADLERRLKIEQSGGRLRALNADYKRRRAEETANGRRFMPYAEFLERYMIGWLYEIAAARAK